MQSQILLDVDFFTFEPKLLQCGKTQFEPQSTRGIPVPFLPASWKKELVTTRPSSLDIQDQGVGNNDFCDFDISPTPFGARKKLMFVGRANKQLYQAIKSPNEISKTNAEPVKPQPEKSVIEETLEQLTQMEHRNTELNRTLDFYTEY